MEDEKTVERQMSTLLDEIILKIINEYIETYALRASQYVSARMNRKGNTTYAPAIENQYYLNPTTLIVKGFLDRKSPKLEYVAGLPKVTNLKLVNKTFYDEIIHTLAAKFDGHLSIEHGSNFCDTEDCKAWRPYTGLLSIVSSAWAYSLVTEIYVSDTLNADRTILALRDGFAPNLRKVLIYGGTLIDEGNGQESGILGGSHNGRQVAYGNRLQPPLSQGTCHSSR